MSSQELADWERNCPHEVVVRCRVSTDIGGMARPAKVANTLTSWLMDHGLMHQRDFSLRYVNDRSVARENGFIQWSFMFHDPGMAALFKLTWGCRDL